MAGWMIYGANGNSGELIAGEAARRSLKPVLAGRNASQVTALADEHGLRHRIFPADTADLSGMTLVLNCAGPFSATARPIIAGSATIFVAFKQENGLLRCARNAGNIYRLTLI